MSNYVNGRKKTVYEKKFDSFFSEKRLKTLKETESDKVESGILEIRRASLNIFLSEHSEVWVKTSTDFNLANEKCQRGIFDYADKPSDFYPKKERLDEYSLQRFLLKRSIQHKLNALDLKPKDKFYLGAFVNDKHISLKDLAANIEQYIGESYKINYRALQSLFTLSLPAFATALILIPQNIEEIKHPGAILFYLSVFELLIAAGFLKYRSKHKSYEEIRSLVSDEVLKTIYTDDIQGKYDSLTQKNLKDFIKNYLVYNLYLEIREHLQKIANILKKNKKIFSIISTTGRLINESISLDQLLNMSFEDFSKYLKADNHIIDEMPAETLMKLELLFRDFKESLDAERSIIVDCDNQIVDLLLQFKELDNLSRASKLEAKIQKVQQLVDLGLEDYSDSLSEEKNKLKESLENALDIIKIERKLKRELDGPLVKDFK